MQFVNDRITIDENICNGKPVVRGLRITVQTILEFLGSGDKPEDILMAYPSLELEDISACLKYASKVLDRQFTIQQVS